MKPISEYTREDILKCLYSAKIVVAYQSPIEKVGTKILKKYLTEAMAKGLAQPIEEVVSGCFRLQDS
jgi:hypothetical protein